MICLRKITKLTLFVSLLGINLSFAMSDEDFNPDKNKNPVSSLHKKEPELQAETLLTTALPLPKMPRLELPPLAPRLERSYCHPKMGVWYHYNHK